jgi:y4mF family transcriptional regulator
MERGKIAEMKQRLWSRRRAGSTPSAEPGLSLSSKRRSSSAGPGGPEPVRGAAGLPTELQRRRTDSVFPSGNFLGLDTPMPPKCPERENVVDILGEPMLISRSVNMVARRTITPAEIGDIVRSTRKAAGLRQDELAGAAGVGLRFIVDLEAGKPTAQLGKTLQVLAALGCSFDLTPPPGPDRGRKA